MSPKKISNVKGYQTISYTRKARDPVECQKNAVKAIKTRWNEGWKVDAVFEDRDSAREYAFDSREFYGNGNVRVKDRGNSYAVMVREKD